MAETVAITRAQPVHLPGWGRWVVLNLCAIIATYVHVRPGFTDSDLSGGKSLQLHSSSETARFQEPYSNKRSQGIAARYIQNSPLVAPDTTESCAVSNAAGLLLICRS